jgi:hypothetical protein
MSTYGPPIVASVWTSLRDFIQAEKKTFALAKILKQKDKKFYCF